ncbi:MAG: ArsR family transcriptional regulator [Candidatus Methanoperedens sp.]|nr:ArsR family transcriptional regulator [Candidatus Methanoperedens sp.]HWR26613.1 ArsR family transcriptional regulator [candidate division Zixibacteria bacterium]
MKSKTEKAKPSIKAHYVEILVLPKEEYFKGLNDLFEQAHKGELKPQPRQIIVSSIDDLNSILTPERVKILKTIRDLSPQSISELADLLGRDRRNVIHDLMYLKGLGFVDIKDEKKDKKAKKPTVDYDAVHVTIPISSDSVVLA